MPKKKLINRLTKRLTSKKSKKRKKPRRLSRITHQLSRITRRFPLITNYKLLIPLVFLVFGFWFLVYNLASPALANGLLPSYNDIPGFEKFRFKGPDTTIGDIFSAALKYIYIFAGLAVGLYLILGGFQLLTSGGDPAGDRRPRPDYRPHARRDAGEPQEARLSRPGGLRREKGLLG